VSQIPKYTFSRISRQKQANSGIGWSDEGIAKYNNIYNLVESDHQLRGATFNQELLKVHQRRRQNNKRATEKNVDNERTKKRKPRYDLRRSQKFDHGPAITQLQQCFTVFRCRNKNHGYFRQRQIL
jgi:hypothetical protein